MPLRHDSDPVIVALRQQRAEAFANADAAADARNDEQAEHYASVANHCTQRISARLTELNRSVTHRSSVPLDGTDRISLRLLEVARSFLRYAFTDAKFNYANLTAEEQEICTEEEFDSLVAHFKL